MREEPLSHDVADFIRSFMRREMNGFGLERVDVKVGPDHDGEDSIMIDLSYRGSERPVDPKKVALLLSKLRDGIWERGEHRFPYIHHHFPENQKVVGFN